MANKIQYQGTLGTYTTLIDGSASAPTLKNLASDGQKIGNAISDNRDTLADFDLYCRFQVAPSTGGYVALYAIPAIDGTNYGDGDDSVAPPATCFLGAFPVRAVTTQQRVPLQMVPIPPGDWKPLIINKSGQAMTNTNGENVLSGVFYNPEIQ